MEEARGYISFYCASSLAFFALWRKLVMYNFHSCHYQLCRYEWFILAGHLEPRGKEYNFIHKED